MQNILILLIIVCSLFLSCTNPHLEYDKNVIVFKELVSTINTYFKSSELSEINIHNYYTDDFIFHSYAAGNKKGQETFKIDYIKNLKQMKSLGMHLEIGHSIYLPGIDGETFQFDGSVRVYYGASISADSNLVDFSGYQTINFKDGKVAEIWEWADYGGVSNQLLK